jgi:tellurite resistance protein
VDAIMTAPKRPSSSPPHRVRRARWLAEATREQKTAAVHILLAVATGDGELSSDEKSAIARACQDLGMNERDVAIALKSGMPQNIEAPKDRRIRTQILLDAAAVMVADHRIDSRELAVLLVVGKSLGFSNEEVTDAAMCAADALREEGSRAAAIDRFLEGRN